MTMPEFLKERFGPNWVLARRTSNIVARYGNDVRCLSSHEYAAAENEYRERFGHPYDERRRELLACLKDMRAALPISTPARLIARLDKCIAEEITAP